MNDVKPLHYRVHLEPDLKNFKFGGITEILIETSKPIHEISLNALELAVWTCQVRMDDEILNCPFHMQC